MTISHRALTLLSVPAVSAAVLVGGASGASAAEGDVQFTNAAGNVRCDVVMTEDGPHVICVSDGARQTMPECNPPEEKIPAVTVFGNGPGVVGCWNQGLIGTKQVLGAGQLGNAHGVTVFADPMGGLHVLSGSLNYVAYAGPTSVGNNPAALSSQLSS
ncbi:hypothetical protein [Corynebacterium sp.]|uniref:hypothetical protein n=1 Tax=Corynebacterium sp. TaxID=1720 RepID=UPI0026E0ACFA|nr:hypothetical protein [Corynebacterium sp.]MDO5513442.1 hypothetical protein [Corynebacterium sp.]